MASGFGGCASHPFTDLKEWKEIRTTKFMFYTNAEEDVAFDLAKKLEIFRAIAMRITTIPPFEEQQPLRVYVFKSLRSFAPYRIVENAGGYFIRGTITSRVMLQRGDSHLHRLSTMNTAII